MLSNCFDVDFLALEDESEIAIRQKKIGVSWVEERVVSPTPSHLA